MEQNKSVAHVPGPLPFCPDCVQEVALDIVEDFHG
jgi:hypothetical protein